MAQPLNTEFNYRYLVQGHTPWEKLKTLKGFLEGRKRAAALEKVAELNYQSKQAELEHLKTTQAPIHLVLALQAELVEIESVQEDKAHAFALNRQEIATLERLIAELYQQCEPTRIPGYSDDQMFEANSSLEFTVMILQKIQAEIIANGRPTAATLQNAMSTPESLKALKSLGIIPSETKPITKELIGDTPLQLTDEQLPNIAAIASS
jgi:hypothetical protein